MEMLNLDQRAALEAQGAAEAAERDRVEGIRSLAAPPTFDRTKEALIAEGCSVEEAAVRLLELRAQVDQLQDVRAPPSRGPRQT